MTRSSNPSWASSLRTPGTCFLRPALQRSMTTWSRTRSNSYRPSSARVCTKVRSLSPRSSCNISTALFSGSGVLQNICEKIVIPNLMFRPWDAENFEDNPLDYIRGDIEGSDKDSRRKTACDLVQSMCRQFEAEVTQMCLGFMQQMLAQYQQDPVNQWRSKDAAITLMIALAIKRYTFQGGVSEVNAKVSVVDFFNQFILPELSSSALDAHPVMKAGQSSFVWSSCSLTPNDLQTLSSS